MTSLVLLALGPGPARRLLERELEDPRYRAAHATWWDRVSAAVLDWLRGIRLDGIGSQGFGRTVLVLAIVVLVAVVVLVVVTRGLPRRRAIARGAAGAGVFDAGDVRRAEELRRAAQGALRSGDWAAAVLEGYRALARGLGERDLVADVPGATARSIARRAADPFPELSDRLDHAADVFDAVRYLDAPADESAARAVVDTEAAVTAARPRAEVTS